MSKIKILSRKALNDKFIKVCKAIVAGKKVRPRKPQTYFTSMEAYKNWIKREMNARKRSVRK